jgi:hypothetical protein
LAGNILLSGACTFLRCIIQSNLHNQRTFLRFFTPHRVRMTYRRQISNSLLRRDIEDTVGQNSYSRGSHSRDVVPELRDTDACPTVSGGACERGAIVEKSAALEIAGKFLAPYT